MKRIRKMLASIVIFVVFSGLFCSCGNSSEVPGSSQDGVARPIEEIKESGYITIGVFKDNKPFGYLDTNGEYQGMDVYLGTRIGKDLGVKVQFIPVDADSREEALETAEVDLVLANYSVTNERSKVVEFGMPYRKTALGVISPSDNCVKDLSQLTDQIVIVVQGTTADLYFTENYPQIKLIRVDQYAEAFDSLEKGLGDALCSNVLQILAWQQEHSEFMMGVTIPNTEAQIAPAVQKDNTQLLEWINTEIASLQKEKFFSKAYDQILQPVYRDTISKEDVIIE